MTTPGPDTAVVRRGTRRVCQLTGDTDADGRPVLNATTRFGVRGAKLAVAIEHAGRLWLVFGNAGADQDGHALAHTTVALLDEDGPALAFVTTPDGRFRPLSVRGLRPLTADDDVVGGTSALGRLWLFVRTGGEEPATYLASAADPADGFVLHYLVSTAAEARAGGSRFLSATAVPTAPGRRDLPAPGDGPGLFVWGQGDDNGVRLGWLSLDPPPRLATGAPHPRPPMLYFAGRLGWSPREGDATTLLRLPGPTLLSVNWLAELKRWVLLYAETGGDTSRISCRTSTTPLDWGEPMTLLDPTLGPYTSWLHAESEPEALRRKFPLPAALPAAARTQHGPRGPSVLTRYTRWDARSATVTIFYTVTGGDASDVHLIASQLSDRPGWRGWRPAPRERDVRAAPGTAPAAAISGERSGPQRSDLVLLGEDGGVWSTWRMDGVEGSDWHAWLRLDDNRVFARRSVTTCVWGAAQFDVFALDEHGGLWRTGWRFDRWLAWAKIGPARGGPVLSTDVPVAATAGYDGRIDVFGLGTDARLWWTWTVADQPWAPWQPLADHLDDHRDSRLARSAPPAALSRPGRLDVFAIGSDDRLWWRGLRGPAWSHWAPAAGLTFRPQTPPVALVRGDGGLELLAVGRDERIWRNAHWEDAGTEVWAGWTTLSPPADDKHAVSLSTASAPAAAWHDTGEVEVFAIGRDGRLWHARYLPAPRPVPVHGWQPLSDWPAAERANMFGTRTGPVTASRAGRVEVYALDEDRRVWRNRWC